MEVQKVYELLNKYKILFSKDISQPAADKVVHTIDTGHQKPINCAPYRVAPKESQLIKDLTMKMMKDNIISESKSPWASPVVLVSQKDDFA